MYTRAIPLPGDPTLKRVTLLIALFVFSLPVFALESDYTKAFCTEDIRISNRTDLGYKLSDGKIVDCLSRFGVAYEVDFAKKAWSEGVGQAIHYAEQASRDLKRRFLPGIIVIVETESDCKDLGILYDQDVTAVILEVGAFAWQCPK